MTPRVAAALAVVALLAARALAAPTLVALLLAPEANAARHRAVVEIRLKGAEPADAENGVHFLVRLDQEPAVATTQTRISFHDIGPGQHTITVALVDADDQPLGARDAVWLSIAAPTDAR